MSVHYDPPDTMQALGKPSVRKTSKPRTLHCGCAISEGQKYSSQAFITSEGFKAFQTHIGFHCPNLGA